VVFNEHVAAFLILLIVNWQASNNSSSLKPILLSTIRI